MKKTIIILLLTALSLTIMSNMAGAEKLRIGFSISTLNNPFFVSLKEEAEKTAENENVELLVVDAQNDSSKQLTDVEDLLQRDIDVIVLDPVNGDSIIPAIKRANQADIPVVTIDRKPNLELGGEIVTHSASDNVTAGRISAEYIAEKLNEEGKIVVLEGTPGTSAAVDRTEGFINKINEYKNIEIVAQQAAGFNRAEGMSVMEDILQSNNEIDAVYAQNDEMALGALRAINNKKMSKDIVITGIDATNDGLQAVKNGEIDMTITMRPDLMGKNAVELAIGAYNGESYPSFIEIPIEPVNKDNVAEYLK